jgi:hypothetical protein
VTKKTKQTKKDQGPGRPPAGIGGRKVSDYTRTTVWLPKETKTTLALLSRLHGEPQWRILTDAITQLKDSLPRADKSALTRMRLRQR